jgi:hypothetical protein
MRNIVLFVFIFTLFSGCRPKVQEADLPKLNGYWEIQKVEMNDGEDKDYKVNPTVDYIQLKGKIGFRQKVMPQLNGSFQTNNIQEKITITTEDGHFCLNYATAYGKWKETLVQLTDSVLVVKNADAIEYRYKKFIPFSKK